MNAIALLKSDHQAVEKLFSQYEKLSDASADQKRNIIDQIIELMSIHAFLEEQYFYPVVKAELEASKHLVLESLEEHGMVKILLSDISNTSPDDERYDAKVKVLMDAVRHHVQEEEDEMFPQVNTALGRKRLEEIGDQLEENRASAPRTPPAGIGYVSKAVETAGPFTDRMRQRARGMVQKVVSAANRRASRATATRGATTKPSRRAPKKTAPKSKAPSKAKTKGSRSSRSR